VANTIRAAGGERAYSIADVLAASRSACNSHEHRVRRRKA